MTSLARLYRFGPYELDKDRNQLRKFGIRLKIERKPLQLLTALVDRSGEVVTRSDLQGLLWGEGVYVDFEKGLSVVVTKLRAALSDSSEDPKYIETVAGEGYRFIAKVEQAIPNLAQGTGTPELTALPAPGPAMATATAPRLWRSWRDARQVTFSAAALMGVVLLALGLSNVNRHRLPRQAGPHAGKIMLVVLPFENLSGDPSQEYLSDGITEELSEQLGNLNPDGLAVIGRTSAMAYKHSSRSISQIGQDLGVGYVLEGSVRRADRRLRVTAQLVEVSDQAHVWAAEYDREVGDMLQLENDLGREITQQVGISVALDSRPQKKRHAPDPEAHEAYLLARYYWNKRTPAGGEMAWQYFRRATHLDPHYAEAYAGLAECGPDDEAKAAALKAVELDPNSGEAHTALGFIEFFRELDVPAAEREFKTAIRLDPNYATARHWYSGLLGSTGRSSEALAEMTEAAKLDPLSLIIRTALAGDLSRVGQQDAAMAQIKTIFDMDPHFAKAHETLGSIYLEKGMYKEAIREFQAADRYGGYQLPGRLGYAYARSGNRKEALRILRELEANRGDDSDMAIVEMGLGNQEKALAWLEKDYERHEDDLLLDLKIEPIFAPLHSDPRFQEIVRHLNLQPRTVASEVTTIPNGVLH